MAHIRSVILNAVDQERSVDFWRALLGVGVLKIDDALGITWLQPDTDDGVTLGIQRVDNRGSSHPQSHFDIAVVDRESTKERILAIGGHLISRQESSGIEWYIMSDPENNHFCIYHD